MPSSLPKAIAFVDVETTGLRATRDRVIEIAVLRVENNQLVDEYHSLIQPGQTLPWFIVRHTGINDELLDDAPSFRQVADEINIITEDCVFAAHSVHFDYSFLKAEYTRIGQQFERPYFCTVELSRRLYPEQRQHNLDAIMTRFGLNCDQRHRAAADVQLLWEFYCLVQKSFPLDRIAQALAPSY
jgi:DNA polymerase III subunit epsilon